MNIQPHKFDIGIDASPVAAPEIAAFEDPLSDSLLYLAARHGRALSRDALVAGLIIGVVESVSAYAIGPVYKDVVVYILFVLVLWFRPQGLMGKT